MTGATRDRRDTLRLLGACALAACAWPVAAQGPRAPRLVTVSGAITEVVFALAQDVTRWPDLRPHYLSPRVAGAEAVGAEAVGGRAVRFVAARPGLVRMPVVWRSRTWSEPDACRLRFLHFSGRPPSCLSGCGRFIISG